MSSSGKVFGISFLQSLIPDIPDISKFSYLRSLLEGEAKQSIQGLSLTSQHYQSTCQILTARFGRKERIIFTHI